MSDDYYATCETPPPGRCVADFGQDGEGRTWWVAQRGGERRGAEADAKAFAAAMNRIAELEAPACVADDDCHTHRVDWRTRCQSAEARALAAESELARMRPVVAAAEALDAAGGRSGPAGEWLTLSDALWAAVDAYKEQP